ncbi:MAG: cadmium-translocating P-type ATPase [Geminicoccaceae bacterium]|nr:cadmium-translocating P-type ATPase [Geminicoccaceae bacterium]
MVEGVHCGSCVHKIEKALQAQPDVEQARLNLTTRRLTLAWHGTVERGTELAAIVVGLGYPVVPFDPGRLGSLDEAEERFLLRCLAVAGFAAANVMLLAVGVWAGHFQGMGEATRTFLHWFEALIALPAILFAGRPFFRSAAAALGAGHTNMDVPISLAVLIAPAMSLYETMRGGEHVYFDSAVTLLFFLLIGRYLDRRARGAARSAAERLMALGSRSVTRLASDGTTAAMRPEDLVRGDVLLVATGERIGADGRLSSPSAEIDTSAISGETVPERVARGAGLFAGTLNIGAPLELRVEAVGEGTLLAEIVRLMELAEQKRGRYVALADRIAGWYAPIVHSLAALTFAGWWLIGGLAWQQALLHAVAVLIVTCPCALGLAVPAVQVIASGRLMKAGILLKSATALERFAEVETVVFDKTGTLTEGTLDLIGPHDPHDLALAAGMAKSSRHPLARALVAACPDAQAVRPVTERPGCGLEHGAVRLGRADWALGEGPVLDRTAGPEIWLARPGVAPVRFAFVDRLRADAASVVAELERRGMQVELLSGDRAATVERQADAAGIACWRAGMLPADKVARLEALAAERRHVAMVGDGLNDAPALAAAHVSLSPSTAVDIAQTAADAVFQGRALVPVLEVLTVARRARSLVRQNLALSFGYNLLAVPLAVAGWVTPLVAAVAMSASSLAVVGNALRLTRGPRSGHS